MQESLESSNRIEWIDVSKGIAIILVVLVHSIIPQINPVTTHLSSFAIPLFFVLAGLTYNPEKHRQNLRRLAKIRGQQYMLPYFCLYTIIMVLFYLVPNAVETYLTPDQLVFWFLYGSGPPDQSTHLWFLPVLYFGFALFILLERVLHPLSRWTRIIVVPSLAVIGFGINSLFSPMLVPWHLGSILIATNFMLIGAEVRNHYGMTSWSTKSRILDVALILALSYLLIFLSELNGFTDIAVDNLGNSVWLYLINGTIGTSATFLLSSLIAKQSVLMQTKLSELGNMSQEVYEFHPLTFLLVTPIMLLAGWTSGDILGNFDNLWFLRFFFGMSISIAAVVFVIRKNSILSIIFTGFKQRRR
ncbi:MAG: acyltransferase family protein [Candidatus Thorarchaeota archaeon]